MVAREVGAANGLGMGRSTWVGQESDEGRRCEVRVGRSGGRARETTRGD